MTEKKIVQHCSPTLAGLKTGNIFRCAFESIEQLHSDIRMLNLRLTPKGLRIIPLRVCGGYAMLYVYRPSMLREDLANPEARLVLAEMGYTNDVPEKCINHLMNRLKDYDDFPHEIGLFLGYPPEDVRGFIENGAKDAKHVGYWKVYGDVDKAQKTFARFSKCNDIYRNKYAAGSSIDQLTVAV